MMREPFDATEEIQKDVDIWKFGSPGNGESRKAAFAIETTTADASTEENVSNRIQASGLLA